MPWAWTHRWCLLLAGAALIVIMLTGGAAHADVIQPDLTHAYTLPYSGASGDYHCAAAQMCAGPYTGLSGTGSGSGQPALYGVGNSGAGGYPTVQVEVLQCDDIGMTTNCTNFTAFQSTFSTGSPHYVNGSIPAVTFLPSKYYTFAFYNDGGGPNTLDIYGTRSDASSTPYLDLYGISYTPPAPPHSGVFPVAPASTTIAYNPVHFTGTYNNLGTFDTLRIALSGPSGSFLVSSGIPLINIVGASYDIPYTINATGTYTYYGYLYDSSDSSISTTSSTYTFDMGTTTLTAWGWSTTTMPTGTGSTTCDTAEGVFAVSLCKLGRYLFEPAPTDLTQFTTLGEQLSHKPPFGYAGALYAALTGPTTTAPWTLDTFLGPGLSDILKTITAFLRATFIILLWILFLIYLINRYRHFDFHL